MQQDPQNPFVPPPPPSFGNSLYSPETLALKENEIKDDAKKALIFSLVGIACFGLILGIFAIQRANSARQNIKIYGVGEQYSGLAIAGLILGILDIVGWGIGIVARIALR